MPTTLCTTTGWREDFSTRVHTSTGQRGRDPTPMQIGMIAERQVLNHCAHPHRVEARFLYLYSHQNKSQRWHEEEKNPKREKSGRGGGICTILIGEKNTPNLFFGVNLHPFGVKKPPQYQRFTKWLKPPADWGEPPSFTNTT